MWRSDQCCEVGKVTLKEQGWTQSIPGPVQGLAQWQSKSHGLSWGLSQTAGLGCPSAGWKSSYCPYAMGFHSFGEKNPTWAASSPL